MARYSKYYEHQKMPATLHTTPVLDRNKLLLDWYCMPESFSSPLVDEAIDEFDIKPGQTVLDPFCGAGTTLVTAILRARNAVGVEVNPFLAFSSRTKTDLNYNVSALKRDATRLLRRLRSSTDRKPPLFSVSEDDGFRLGAPDMPRVFEWISPKVVGKVLFVRDLISRIKNQKHRNVALLALAAILRPVSNMKLSPHAFGSREVHRDARVFELFDAKLSKMIADIEEIQDLSMTIGIADLIQDDARRASYKHTLLPAHIGITSPPYLNNLDYTMQTRLELFFLGFVKSMTQLKELRKRMIICDAKAMYRDVHDLKYVEGIASIRRVSKQLHERLAHKNWGWDYSRMTLQYFGGMYRTLQNVSRMLWRGARFLLVVGESAHSGVFVPVPSIIGEIGESLDYIVEDIRVQRKRRSSSHDFELAESIVILRRKP